MTKNILVIDDELSVQKSFILALENMDYVVDVANDGRQGLSKAKEKNYHLIFLDLRMPGMGGIETAEKIRKIDKDLPIYIVTAFCQEYLEDLGQLREKGIEFELLSKPIDSVQIKAVVKGVLEGAEPY